MENCLEHEDSRDDSLIDNTVVDNSASEHDSPTAYKVFSALKTLKQVPLKRDNFQTFHVAQSPELPLFSSKDRKDKAGDCEGKEIESLQSKKCWNEISNQSTFVDKYGGKFHEIESQNSQASESLFDSQCLVKDAQPEALTIAPPLTIDASSLSQSESLLFPDNCYDSDETQNQDLTVLSSGPSLPRYTTNTVVERGVIKDQLDACSITSAMEGTCSQSDSERSQSLLQPTKRKLSQPVKQTKKFKTPSPERTTNTAQDRDMLIHFEEMKTMDELEERQNYLLQRLESDDFALTVGNLRDELEIQCEVLTKIKSAQQACKDNILERFQTSKSVHRQRLKELVVLLGKRKKRLVALFKSYKTSSEYKETLEQRAAALETAKTLDLGSQVNECCSLSNVLQPPRAPSAGQTSAVALLAQGTRGLKGISPQFSITNNIPKPDSLLVRHVKSRSATTDTHANIETATSILSDSVLRPEDTGSSLKPTDLAAKEANVIELTSKNNKVFVARCVTSANDVLAIKNGDSLKDINKVPLHENHCSTLLELIKEKKIQAGTNVLSVVVSNKNQTVYGSVTRYGFIQNADGEIYKTPQSWCRTLFAYNMNKKQAYKKVSYKGVPLFEICLNKEKNELNSRDNNPTTIIDSPEEIPSTQSSSRFQKKDNGAKGEGKDLLSLLMNCTIHLISDKELFPYEDLEYSDDLIRSIDQWP